VVGLSLDFQLLNMLGFLSYAIYNAVLFYNGPIRRHYAALHSHNPPAVHANDVFFALHAATATAATLLQCCIYERGGARLAPSTIAAVSGAVVIAVVWAGAVVLFPAVDPGTCPHPCPGASLLTWLSWLYYLSYIKLAVTLVKYLPQVVLNCRRRSTEGWNIANVLLDLEGGALSLVQLFMDADVCSDWSPFVGNPVKFALGCSSLLFDAVFMAQHYILYPGAWRTAACRAMSADFCKPELCFGPCAAEEGLRPGEGGSMPVGEGGDSEAVIDLEEASLLEEDHRQKGCMHACMQ